MSLSSGPARVVGFVAAEADVCVLVVNHSKFLNLMVRWDLDRDSFEIGQWLSKEIAFGKSALSPDGKLLGYKILCHERRPTDGPPPGHYIVVSRPPYFSALALWWTGDEPENRVRWEGNRAVSVGKPAGTPPDIGTLPEDFHVLDPKAVDSDLPRATASDPRQWHDSRIERIESKGFKVRGEPTRERFFRLFYGWVDVDHRGRLLFAREGRVYVHDADGERELIDLSLYEFEAIPPLSWGKRWPEI